MKPYLLTEVPKDIFNAGFKAKNDIRVALQAEVEDLTVPESFRFDKIPAFLRLMWQLGRIPKGSRLYIQCPIYSFFNQRFMSRLCDKLERGCFRITLILHDVDSLRYPDRAEWLGPLERRLYHMAETVIVHNESMKEILQQTHGLSPEKMVTLGIFDYLYDRDPVGADADYTRTVFVAGNLDPEKSGYIYGLGRLADTLTINLYGGNFRREAAPETLRYQGSFPPDELPRHLQGNFGLIWDGISVTECTGQTGEYLRINNPHKTSLYLAAGFPVIIWKQAALAPFIVENGLGLAVDSLEELPRLLEQLTDEEYRGFVANVASFGALLRRGAYIRKALEIE